VSDDIYQVENHYLRTALRAKDADYRALLEAVEWERECEAVKKWTDRYRVWPACIEAERIHECARASVDALTGAK
jgi:hypothetical protein